MRHRSIKMHNTALYTIDGLCAVEGRPLFLGIKLIHQQRRGCEQLTRTFSTKSSTIPLELNPWYIIHDPEITEGLCLIWCRPDASSPYVTKKGPAHFPIISRNKKESHLSDAWVYPLFLELFLLWLDLIENNGALFRGSLVLWSITKAY